MLKRMLSAFLSLCLILTCCIVADFSTIKSIAATTDDVDTSVNYGLVDNVQYGQILHCWNWSFDNIRKNMALIASQGFTAIQTSPIQSSKESTRESWSSVQNSVWVYYQPISFNIEQNSWNALGTKSQFEAMCAEAHKYGVKVIVDTVFNHMANDSTENTINPQITSDLRDDSNCWYSVTWNTSNWEDRYDVTHNCLSGFPDLNTSNSKVQNYAIGFLKECIDAGADGFRFDAVKHIETPADAYGTASDFWPNVLGTATYHAQQTRGITPYYYGELLGSAGGGLPVTAYTDHMSVTDSATGNNIRNAIASGNASGACQSGISNGAHPTKTVQWNESHDTYYADNDSIWISNENMKKTWAIVGSRAEVCGLYLARPENNSTTMLGDGDITAWADKEVKAINRFKNYFAGHPEYLACSGNIVYNERGNTGVVLVNASGGSTSVSVPAHRMYDGVYTDAITGNHFSVSNGNISGEIGSSGIAVVYSYPATVNIDKSSQAFRGDTLDVTLSYTEATSGTYSIDGDYAKNYNNGDVISIGCGAGYGEDIELVATATGGTTTDSAIRTYKKLHPDTDLKIYFDNGSKNWSQVYAYVYNEDGDKIASWPGTMMTYDSSLGLYYIDVPKGYETSKVVFNDGNGNQTPSSGGHSFNAYTSIYKDGYFYGYNTGISGTLYFKPSENWLTSNARFAVYVWNNSGNAWVNFKDSNADGIYEATLPSGTWNECIFARMTSSSTSNSWDNVWNKTGDMGISNNNNYFMIADGWDTSEGTWSIIDKSVVNSSTDAVLVGNFNNWDKTKNPFVYTDYNKAVTSVDLPAGKFTFKLIKNDEWFGNPGTIQDTTAGVGWTMSKNDTKDCTLEATGGTYTFTLDTETLKITVDFEAKEVPPIETVPPSEDVTEPPTQIETETPTETPTEDPDKLQPGYYLVGTLNGVDCWGIDKLSKDRLFKANPYNSGEYMLEYTMTLGDEIKVVHFDGEDYTAWYNSAGDNYGIGSSKVGLCDIYFRPEGNSSWSYTYFTVIPRPVEETVVPTDEPTDETEPPTDPTEAPTDPTEAPTDPTEAPTDPTEPPTDPTEPPTEQPTQVKPIKVENFKASSVGSTSIQFSWDELEGASKYWIYQYSEKYDTWSSVTSSRTNSALVKMLVGSTNYKFKIIAKVDTSGMLKLDDAELLEVTTKAPVAAASISAISGVVTADITWEPVEGAIKYWVYKGYNESGPYYCYSSSYEPNLTVKRLRPDSDYYFRVVAMTRENGLDCFSNVNDSPTVKVHTGSASIITAKSESNTGTTATISWPAFANAEKYWVMYSTTSADTTDRSHWTTWTSTTDTTFTFTKLEPNTVYYLNVCAKYTEDNAVCTIDYIPIMVRTAYSNDNFIEFTPVDDTHVTLTWDEDIENVAKTWICAIDENGKEISISSTTSNSVTIRFADYKNYSYALKVIDDAGRVGYLTKSGGEKYHE